jgi:hypothetical protein
MIKTAALLTLTVLGAAFIGTSLVSLSAFVDDQEVIDYREHIMKTLNEQSAALGQILSTPVPGDNTSQHLQAIALRFWSMHEE